MFRGMISVATSLEITFISMIVVFTILTILSFVLSLFKYIPSAKIENVEKSEQPILKTIEKERFNPDNIKNEEMRVAMMVACIEAAGEDKDANIRVVGIKELN
ncbi:MAG: OadG family protein [Cetobacterium sp.]